LQVDASKLQVDASKLQVDASKLQVDASKLQVDAFKLQVDASKLQLDKLVNLIYVENRSFCPHPKSLSQVGRGTTLRLPFSQIWEKGLGDEGLFLSYRKNYSFQGGRGLVRILALNFSAHYKPSIVALPEQ
jgi:hypothetical protein